MHHGCPESGWLLRSPLLATLPVAAECEQQGSCHPPTCKEVLLFICAGLCACMKVAGGVRCGGLTRMLSLMVPRRGDFRQGCTVGAGGDRPFLPGPSREGSAHAVDSRCPEARPAQDAQAHAQDQEALAQVHGLRARPGPCAIRSAAALLRCMTQHAEGCSWASITAAVCMTLNPEPEFDGHACSGHTLQIISWALVHESW